MVLWSDITSDVMSGNLDDVIDSGYENNNRLRIHNGNFQHAETNFSAECVYHWNGVEWEKDIDWEIPIITKSNFRDGIFGGEFNSGVFGTNEKKIDWQGATWNNGFLLNSRWVNGDLNSKLLPNNNIVSEINTDGIPRIKSTGPNNNNRGYNYIINSEFIEANIENGIFIKTSLNGSPLDNNISSVENHILKAGESHSLLVKSGEFNNCVIKNTKMMGTDIIRSKSDNSKLENVKSINSVLKSSVLLNSTYISDDDIKILGYDEYTIAEIDNAGGEPSHKVYKFYINPTDFNKLKMGDYFYIKGLEIRDGSNYPINLFDRKFRLSSWVEYIDAINTGHKFYKRGIEVGAFLSTPLDNEWSLNWTKLPTLESVVVRKNENPGYSIDIVISLKDIDGLDVVSDGVIKEIPSSGLVLNREIKDSVVGLPEEGFITGSGFDGKTNVIKVDKLGRILVGGEFTTYRGSSANGIIRLNPDGTIDTTFNYSDGFGRAKPSPIVYAIEIDSNDRILVGGSFTLYQNVATSGLVRLNDNGSINKTFNISSNSPSGNNCKNYTASNQTANPIAVLYTDCFLESKDINVPSFGQVSFCAFSIGPSVPVPGFSITELGNCGLIQPPTIRGRVEAIKIDAEGKILIGGFFNIYDGVIIGALGLGNILRLNDDGTRDMDFNATFNSTSVYDSLQNLYEYNSIKDIKIDSNGNIMVVGCFDGNIVRLEPINGNIDPTFSPPSVSGCINSISILDGDSGDMFIAGAFPDKILKINSIGDIDPTFSQSVLIMQNEVIFDFKILGNKIYIFHGKNAASSPGQLVVLDKDTGDVDGAYIIHFNDNRTILGGDFSLDSNVLYLVGDFSLYGDESFNSIIALNINRSTPRKIANIVDIQNSFISNSDFDSGIVENTDWISGNHINYGNDNLIVDELVEKGGTYSITIENNNLFIKTRFDSDKIEITDNCLKVGDVVFLNNVEYFLDENNAPILLGDSFKVVNSFSNSTYGKTIELMEIGSNTIGDIIGLGNSISGVFLTIDAENRYNYIHKTKITKSKINSGIFRRAYIEGSLLNNEDFDISDLNFSNIRNIRTFIVSDSIFKNSGNIFFKGLFMNSSFVSGNDSIKNGFLYQSILNGLTFSGGVFKKSSWLSGDFTGGIFYKNNSFDAAPTDDQKLIVDNRVKSYYRDGETGEFIFNDRYSWVDGDFNGGDFVESDWEYGNFNDGDFYFSKFYDGIINGGIFGKKSYPSNNTIVYRGVVNFTRVDNANFIASNVELNGDEEYFEIVWNDGVFNDGVFASGNLGKSFWKNGKFNGGDFTSMAVWENGVFNGGRFLSTYSDTSEEASEMDGYSWQSGIFNGGIFGNGTTHENSKWFTGEFNGGKFIGKIWKNGVFTNGEFIGSGGTYSARGDVSNAGSNAAQFTEPFINGDEEYYGLWIDGLVERAPDNFFDKKISMNIERSSIPNKPAPSVLMRDFLWMGGTFNHSSGKILNSVWLDGRFKRGTFESSSFNPFVKRNIGDAEKSFNLEDSCIWENGNLINSDFYISKWETGVFDTGDSYGMIWLDGVCNYMNAFNIFWEDGIWKNGNWYGSFINYNGQFNTEDDGDSEFSRQLLARGASWSGTQSMHIWNIFEGGSKNSLLSGATATTISSSSIDVGIIEGPNSSDI
jgi:uncharacterized delta-60 repeat protein